MAFTRDPSSWMGEGELYEATNGYQTQQKRWFIGRMPGAV